MRQKDFNEAADVGALVGAAIAVVVMIFLWCMSASITEQDKVKAGYLTCKGKIYKVELVGEIKDNKWDLIEQAKGESK